MKWAHYIWSLTERLGASAVSLVGNIVLARLLLPDDFGLVAMLGVFTAVSYALVDCGLSDGLLREAAPSRRDFNTLFFFNTAAALVVALLFVAAAPCVAALFRQPEAQPIMAVLGLGALFSGLSIAQATRLRSQMRFRHLALINIGAITAALAVAVVMAWRGMRHWALVELQVGFSAFYLLLLLLTSRWQLRWEFDVARFRQLWRFGVNLLCSAIVVQLSQNILASVLGRHYNATQAGYMGQAQKLQQTPVNAVEAGISNATFVLVSKQPTAALQDATFVRVFGRFCFVLTMLCGGAMALSEPLIECIFSARWLPAVSYLRLLLCWALVYPLGHYLMVLLKLRNATGVIRNIIVTERLAIIAAALLLHRWGVTAMIGAFALISAVAVVSYMRHCARRSGITVATLLAAYGSALFWAVLVAAGVWLVARQLAPWPALLLGGALWAAMALALYAALFSRGRNDVAKTD